MAIGKRGAVGEGAIVLAANDLNIGGTLFAPEGSVQFLKLGGIYRCGVVANKISVVGANTTFQIDDVCLSTA